MPKITDRFAAKLAPPPKGNKKRVCDVYWDDSLKGFGVYITANQAVSYFFNYRTKAGRLRRISIGSPPTYTATAARNVATRYKLKVDQGGDPLADKEGERDAPTVADLCTLYLDTHAKSKRPVPQKTDRYTIEKEILPAIKHLKVADVKFADVAKLHRKISERAPYRANRILALLSTMFGVAIKQGWRADNPTKGVTRNLGDAEGALPVRRRARPVAGRPGGSPGSERGQRRAPATAHRRKAWRNAQHDVGSDRLRERDVDQAFGGHQAEEDASRAAVGSGPAAPSRHAGNLHFRIRVPGPRHRAPFRPQEALGIDL